MSDFKKLPCTTKCDPPHETHLVDCAGGKIEAGDAIARCSDLPTVYTQVVRVDTANPNSAAIFDATDIPPTTHDPALEELAEALYIGSDGTLWVWSGTEYVTAPEQPLATPFYLQSTTIDAAGNKVSNIYRLGGIAAGADRIYGNLTASGGTRFFAVPPYGISSIGKIEYGGWTGSGFLFANSTTGTSAFSMVYNADNAFFGALSPGLASRVWSVWSAIGVTINSPELANLRPSNNPSARLAVNSTTQGFLPPRMTTAQINAIASPADGLMVYNTTLNKLCVREAGAWKQVTTTPM